MCYTYICRVTNFRLLANILFYMTIYNFENIPFSILREKLDRLETVLKENIKYNLLNPEPEEDYKMEIWFNNQIDQIRTYLQANNELE